MPASQNIPKSWPKTARDLFEPVRPLGKGGFGAVWLAETKKSSTPPKEGDVTANARKSEYVAIKLVGHALTTPISKFEQFSEQGYFRREVEVLQEISHPRIINLLQCIEEDKEESKEATPEASPYCLVLEYCAGPTLEQLIKHGAALGLCMAREISSQLIDAVSYLHGRGVLHRDIKPDNIVIKGARPSEEACWSDGKEGEDAARESRWNIKLIDFGFARPLHPDDIQNPEKFTTQQAEPDDDHFGRSTVDGALFEKDNNDSLSISTSISQAKILDMSAVGHRNYAAPEMLKGVRNFSIQKKSAPLTECVSDYGMIADAYSVGSTIRYMVTGVPPEFSINDFLAEKNSCMNVISRKLKAKFGKDKNKRKKNYRRTKNLPKEASKLLLGLTHWNEKKRTTIRSARNFQWIKGSFSMQNSEGLSKSKSNEHNGKIDFLKCALNRDV
jgi:serine/threonine protein kinase